MTIDQRIARLERENRRLKIGGLVLLLGFASVFLAGFAPRPPANEFRARRFVVVDHEGRIVAELRSAPRGPSLRFYNAEGNVVHQVP